MGIVSIARSLQTKKKKTRLLGGRFHADDLIWSATDVNENLGMFQHYPFFEFSPVVIRYLAIYWVSSSSLFSY